MTKMQKYCDDEKYLCDTCESIFQFPLKFFNHCIFEHGHEEEKITFDCAICYRSFSEIPQFKQHIKQKLVLKMKKKAMNLSLKLNLNRTQNLIR